MLVTVLLGAASLWSPQETAPPPPNVLIVLMDDVGCDKIGLYGVGVDPAPTPHLDALAARGVRFTRAWATQACSPTRAALLTGRHSDRTGIGAVIRPDDGLDTPLALSECILPEALTAHRATHVGKWHLGDESSPAHHPMLSGFDASIGWKGSNNYFRWTERNGEVLAPRTGYFPQSMADHVARIVQTSESPYFIYYATKLGHTPFHDPPEGYHSQEVAPAFPRRQHKAMVEALDTVLGGVLEAVDLDTTYVFVMGDNGSPGHTVAPPLKVKQNKGTFYEGGLNVPLIVAGPGVREGATCEAFVQATDLFATILELTGTAKPEAGAEDSVSFAPQLRSPDAPGQRKFLYAHRFPHKGGVGPNIRAVRNGRWKLIDNVKSEERQLYDLMSDPLERKDLAAVPSAVAPFDLESQEIQTLGKRDQEVVRAYRELLALLPASGAAPYQAGGDEDADR